MSDSHTVIVTEHLDAEAQHWLSERCTVVQCASEDPDFGRQLPGAHGLVVRTYTTLDRTILRGAPNLKVIGRAGVGLDNIDLDACRAQGIEVVYRPEANTQAVVEYVLCLLGDALRPRAVLTGSVDPETWSRVRSETVGARQFSELTLGILGLGRIGKRLAQVFAAIGGRVLYNDLLEVDERQRWGAEPVGLQTLFGSCDVVSVHVDGRASNRNFVGERLLERLKSDAIFINTSRGFVVDNNALAGVLRNRPEVLALLDVHEPEPFGDDYPLLGLPNVRLYPHLASRTEFAMREMSWVVKDVVAVLEGEAPEWSAT